ncbi:putative Zn-binding protein involved in type VI secretion [Herbaspirillum rubrisubalbicans]|uniref:PAAR domain-containing protein n=1 Tax=Herbaspirillum rubrisubalbicans TaxID=80842 RepID=UPI0020A042C2|nr:PAAR domain-containing protein [Herbaspirillum rubrisubalbicans]MCP1573609.1 putative Zn-binding protein involved in type VI secretion [Herbaspirillum rubrisubalbicans]
MSRPFITLGDKTSHGGTVISADHTSSIHGKYMARVGDKVVCPKCKGVFAIKSGAPDMVDSQGRGYARHLDTTECGASLISAQATTTWSDDSMIGDSAADTKAEALSTTSQLAASTDSGICLDCLRKAAHFGSPVVIRE